MNDSNPEEEKKPLAENTKTRVLRHRSDPVSFGQFMSQVFVGGAGQLQEGDRIILFRPDTYKVSSLNATGISDYSSYARFEVDETNGDILVWNLSPLGDPNLKVEKLFSFGKG